MVERDEQIVADSDKARISTARRAARVLAQTHIWSATHAETVDSPEPAGTTVTAVVVGVSIAAPAGNPDRSG